MQFRKLVPLFVALTLVTLSGCGAISGSGNQQQQTTVGEPVITSGMSAEEIKRASANASKDISTYEMTLNVSAEADSTTVEMTADGVVNRDAKKAWMDMSVDAGLRSVDTTVYIVDQTMYVKDPNGDWQSQPVSEGNGISWDQANQLQRQQELLNNSNITKVGSTTVDGAPVTVLSVDPDTSTVMELARSRQNLNPSEVSLSDISMKMYVSNQTGLVRKMEMDMTMTTDGKTVTTDMTVTLSNFGKDTDIQVPDAAK